MYIGRFRRNVCSGPFAPDSHAATSHVDSVTTCAGSSQVGQVGRPRAVAAGVSSTAAAVRRKPAALWPSPRSQTIYDTKQPASRCAPRLCGANHTLTIPRDSALCGSGTLWYKATSLHLLRTSRPCSESASAPYDLHGDLSLGCSNVGSGRVPPPVRSLLTVQPEVFTASRGMEVSSPGGPRCSQRRGAWRFRHPAGAHKQASTVFAGAHHSATLERPPSVPVYLGGPFFV